MSHHSSLKYFVFRMSLSYKLFLLSILFLPYTGVGRFYYVKPSELVLLLLFAIYFFDIALLKRKITLPPLTKYLIIFLVYLTITSILHPPMPEEVYTYPWYKGFFKQNKAFFYLGRCYFLVLTYYVFMNMIKNYEELITALKAVIVSTMAYIIIVFIWGIIDQDKIFEKVSSWVLPYRLAALNSEPNSFGIWLCSVFFLFLTLTYFNIEGIKMPRKVSAVCAAVLGAGMFLSFSVAGYLAITVGCLIFYWRKRISLKGEASLAARVGVLAKFALIGIVVVIGMDLLNLTPYFHGIITNKFVGLMKVFSWPEMSGPRGLCVITNVMIFLRYPLFGVGIGRAPYFLEAFYPYEYRPTNFRPDLIDSDSMNSYTLLLCETGIFGVLILSLILVNITRYCYTKSLTREGKIISLYTVPTMAALFVEMCGSADVHYQIYFIFSLVILIRNYQINKIKE